MVMSGHWGEVAVELLRLLVNEDGAVPESLRARAADVLPSLVHRNISTLYYIAFDPHNPAQRMCDRLWAVQRRLAHDAVAALISRGIPALVFKGVDFLARHFGPHRLLNIGDVDVIVPHQTLGDALLVLQDLGYDNRRFGYSVNKWSDDDPFIVADWEATHDHELWPLSYSEPINLSDEESELCREIKPRGIAFAERGPECHFKIDLHFNVGPDFRIENAIARAIPGAIDVGLAFSASDHLWLAAVRYYKGVACYDIDKIHHLAYLTRHLARSAIDWDLVVREVTEVNSHIAYAAPAMFYTLGLLAHIDQRLVPREIVDRLRPSGARRDDWGWQVGKLFGFTEACPIQIMNGRLQGASPWKVRGDAVRHPLSR
jgi:hypothetical protein